MHKSTFQKPKILMVTVVWGDWHINALFNANISSLLASGNIQEMARRCDIIYRIYTRQSDLNFLESSPVMKEISSWLSIEFVFIPEGLLSSPIDAHHWGWRNARADAGEAGRYILYLPPDVAWSDGSFAYLAGLLEKGKKAVFMTYLRVVSDTFLPALRKFADKESGVISIKGADLVSLALQHLHPLMAAYSYDSPYFPRHSEMIMWPVKGEGVLLRVLAREMFLYDPKMIGMTNQFLMDGNFKVQDVFFISNSDDLFAISLAPIGQDAAWHMNYQKATPLGIAHWWLNYDTPANDFTAGTPIRWHTGDPTEKYWKAREIESERFIRQAIASREGLRIWYELKRLGCHLSASILACAVGFGLVQKAFTNASDAIVFVPSDEVMRRLPTTVLDNMLNKRKQDNLIKFLRSHVAFNTAEKFNLKTGEALLGKDQIMRFKRIKAADIKQKNTSRLLLVSAAEKILTVKKTEGSVTVDGIDIRVPEYMVGRYSIYIIEGILDPAMETISYTIQEGK